MPPDKPLAHISPSQIKTMQSCPTKWWAEKRLGLRGASTEATRFGGVLHAVAECYLIPVPEPEHLDYIVRTTKSGSDPSPTKADIGRAWGLFNYNVSLGLLPAPGEGVVEGEVEIPMDSGVPLKGRFDHLSVIEHPETGDLCPMVRDHKTTSSPNYAESESTLRTNVQAIVYGYYGLQNMPLAPAVCVQFIYYQTKQRKHGWQVTVWLTREEVEEGWRSLTETNKQMLAWYNEDDIEKIPRTVGEDSCRAFYRNCPAMGVCPEHKKKQQSPLDSMLQTSRNLAVKAAPRQESTMSSTPEIFNPRNSIVIKAYFKSATKQQEVGLSPEQAETMLAEYERQEGWCLDPSVLLKTKSLDIIKQGAEVVRARAVKQAEAKVAVTQVAAPPVTSTRQLTDDELGTIETLTVVLDFPEDIAMGLVRNRPAVAQEVISNETPYAEWAEANEQPDMTPEREAPVEQPKAVAKSPPKAAAKGNPLPLPEPSSGDGFSATRAIAEANNIDAVLIKGFATTLKARGMTIEEGLLALVQTSGGKALSTDEVKAALKSVFKMDRVRDVHINAVFLLLGQTGGEVLQVPTLDGGDPVVAPFDPAAYLEAHYPGVDVAVAGCKTPEEVVAVVNKKAAATKPPVLRTRAEAAALAATQPPEEPVAQPKARTAPVSAPAPAPGLDEVDVGVSVIGACVLVDAIAVGIQAVSLDALYDETVQQFIDARGTHPNAVPYGEGKAEVALAFRAAAAATLADANESGNFLTIRSTGAAYDALNGVFSDATVIVGVR